MQMKRIIKLTILVLFLSLKLSAIDTMPIIVEVTEANKDLFVKQSFTENQLFFTNRSYRTSGIPSEFSGCEFLSSAGGVPEKGVIIPSSDGTVYLLGPPNGVLGWDLVENSSFNTTPNPSIVKIYKKNVKANERIELPTVTDFRGVSPIAKQINLKIISESADVSVSRIIIDGKDVRGVSIENTDYSHYLPYTYNQIPEITAKTNYSGAQVSIMNVQNLFGEESERTATITVTSQDGTQKKIYKIIFTILPKLDLFLCIGQSNMAGTAPLDPAKGDLDYINGAYLLNSSNIFEEARNGMNRYANILSNSVEYYGLTYSFAKQIRKQINKPIGLIVNARGGSSIQLWEKEGTDSGDTLYSKTLTRALEAKKWGEFKAVLWHQGEANYSDFNSINYLNLLNKFVNNLRTDLDNQSLFFVAGEIGYWNSSNKPFNDMLNTIGQHITNAACVSAEGLENVINDNSHFNRDALEILGQRYVDRVSGPVYGQYSGLSDNNYGLSMELKENKLCVTVSENESISSHIMVYNVVGQLKNQSTFGKTVNLELNKGINIVCVKTNEQTIHGKFYVK